MHSSTNDNAMPALSATRYAPAPRPSFSVRPELWALVPILAALNLHLVVPGVLPPLHFRADLVAAGEWWRLLTHPFVHVSGWHLFLDGAAFLLLQAGLREPSLLRRLAFAASSAAGALAAAVLLHEETAVLGYCGLSGAAHGLMAVSALELALGRAGAGLRRAGVILLAIVAVKSGIEAWTGECVLDFIHMGRMGVPVAISHAGGLVGGLLAYATFASSPRPAVPPVAPDSPGAGAVTLRA